MQTRTALQRLGGAQQSLGNGPLADIAERLTTQMQDREAARLDDAYGRAEQMGSGPHLAALQRLAREYSTASLHDNTAPVIMRADMHELLQAASKAVGAKDRGLARAATHAYRLWSKDPTGSLTVGDIARLRDHYKAEYPRSKVAEVIDTQVPKVGYNTLPVARLTRLAADISRRVATGEDAQGTYEHAMQVNGFDRNIPECIRARAFVRGLLADTSPEASSEDDVVTRTYNRMATADDPVLGRGAQLDDIGSVEDDLDTMGAPDGDAEGGEADAEHATVDSPITGEPMTLELETEAEEEGELGDNTVDISPEDSGRLEFMGQLEDLMGDDNTLDIERGDISSDATPEETTVVIPDPTDPEGGDLEVTLKPIEEEAGPDSEELGEPELEQDMEQEAAYAKCSKCGGEPCECPEDMEREGSDKCTKCDCDPCECMEHSGADKCTKCDADPCSCDDKDAMPWDKKSFVVYAYSNGKRASEPLDRFEAVGRSAALRHIADQGVKGEVRSTAAAMANEALIVIDANKGEYLQVTAEVSGETDAKFHPKINEQQPTWMSGPTKDTGGAALKSDSMGKQRGPKKAERLTDDEVTKRCASLNITPDTVEHRILEGETVKVAGWELCVNDDADIELKFQKNGSARTASLVHTDDMISTFMQHVAQAWTAPTPLYYDVVERFVVKCAGCGSLNEYAMPEEPLDIDCPDCNHIAKVAAIAQTFEQGDPISGYTLVTDVPAGSDPRDQKLNAKRILAAIRKVLPGAQGMFRKDARLQVDLEGADTTSLNRVRKVLEDRYGIKTFSIEAQAVAQPMTDSQGNPQQDATSAPAATGTGASYVGPPQAPQIQPTTPAQPAAPVAQTGTGAQQKLMADHSAAFHVHYKTGNGEVRSAPVQAASAEAARQVFARFNDDVTITKIEAQMPLAPEPEAPMDIAPGAPEMGGEQAPMPMEPQIDESGLGGFPAEPPMMETPAGHLGPDEADAMRAALTHYRNQGLGPMSALDQLNSQYRELIDRYGEKTDHQRHMIEAEAMKLAAEVWMKPAVLNIAAAQKRGGDLPLPGGINTQQPDAVSPPKDLGKNSDDDDSVTNSLEAPKINTQVKPQGTFSDTSTEPDSDNNDPGDFGAGKPKTQHPATDQQGTSLSDTNLGKDSDTGDTKTTKSWESVSSGAANNVRSK